MLAYMSFKDEAMTVDYVDTRLFYFPKEKYIPGFEDKNLKRYTGSMKE